MVRHATHDQRCRVGRARIGDDTANLKFTVPEGACAPETLLPDAQALANQVADLAKTVEERGRCVIEGLLDFTGEQWKAGLSTMTVMECSRGEGLQEGVQHSPVARRPAID